jgi:hypothetical protein
VNDGAGTASSFPYDAGRRHLILADAEPRQQLPETLSVGGGAVASWRRSVWTGGFEMTDTPNTSTEREGALIGNRLTLAGAVIYLLEWVAIIAATPPGPFGPGSKRAETIAEYAGHAGGAAFAVGWFAVVLLGRVLFIAGLKAALRGRPRELPLLDLALGAMTVSVVLEIVTYSLVAATARLAADGATGDVVIALDDGAYWINLMIWGPIGVSVLAAGVAMLRSRLFRSWLCWLALVAGTAAVVASVLTGATADRSGADLAEAVTSIAALGMWIWMIGTGVVVLRRR